MRPHKCQGARPAAMCGSWSPAAAAQSAADAWEGEARRAATAAEWYRAWAAEGDRSAGARGAGPVPAAEVQAAGQAA